MRVLPFVVPGVGIEPTSPYGTADFKSAAFAISPPRHRYDFRPILPADRAFDALSDALS